MKGRLEELAKFVLEKKIAGDGDDEKSPSKVRCLDCLKRMVPSEKGKDAESKMNDSRANKGTKTAAAAAGGEIILSYGFAANGLKTVSNLIDRNFYAILKNKHDGLEKRIPVDMFLCAGGAGDKLRVKLLGMS
jgi:hypothetical protein